MALAAWQIGLFYCVFGNFVVTLRPFIVLCALCTYAYAL